MYNLHRKGGLAGERRSPLRCLSQFISYYMEINQLLMALLLRTFLQWNCLVFIVGDHDDFPC